MSGFAITSLVLGILSDLSISTWFGLPFYFGIVLPVLSLFFGIFALRDIKKNNKKGAWLAITGIILGSLMIFYFLVAVVVFRLF